MAAGGIITCARGFLDFDFDSYGVHPEAGMGLVEELDVLDGDGKFEGSGDGLACEAGLQFAGHKVDGAFYASGSGLRGITDAADENVEALCRRTLTVGDSTTKTVKINIAGGRALGRADRSGFAGAAKIADGVVVVAYSGAGELEDFVLQLQSGRRWLMRAGGGRCGRRIVTCGDNHREENQGA